MDENTLNLAFSLLISIIAHLLALVASIIIFYKNKSLSTIIMLIGSVLMFIESFGTPILKVIIARDYGVEALIKFQVTSSYFNAISFFVFILGLFLFAINDLKRK